MIERTLTLSLKLAAWDSEFYSVTGPYRCGTRVSIVNSRFVVPIIILFNLTGSDRCGTRVFTVNSRFVVPIFILFNLTALCGLHFRVDFFSEYFTPQQQLRISLYLQLLKDNYIHSKQNINSNLLHL